jgi:hypothetical protein
VEESDVRRNSINSRFGSLALSGLVGMLACCSIPARATEYVWATGKVLDARGRPVPNAFVAVYDDGNKVVDYTRTDSAGDYALAVPKPVLHLEHKRGKGFVADVFTGVIRLTGDAIGFINNPVRSGIHAIASAQSATIADPLTKGGISAGTAVADQALIMLTPRGRRPPPPTAARKQPGALLIKVVAPNSNDLVEVGHVYWIQEEQLRLGGKAQKTLAAWLDPVQLTSVDSEKLSAFQTDYLHFTRARLEPSIAEPGQVVHITAKLLMPPSPVIYAVVVARNNHTGQRWELLPTGDGRYEGEFVVDKRFKQDDQTISILAYAAKDQKPGRRENAEKAIQGAGLWDPQKPYVYDPLLVVSRNRADLTLTIVTPEKRKR